MRTYYSRTGALWIYDEVTTPGRPPLATPLMALGGGLLCVNACCSASCCVAMKASICASGVCSCSSAEAFAAELPPPRRLALRLLAPAHLGEEAPLRRGVLERVPPARLLGAVVEVRPQRPRPAVVLPVLRDDVAGRHVPGRSVVAQPVALAHGPVVRVLHPEAEAVARAVYELDNSRLQTLLKQNTPEVQLCTREQSYRIQELCSCP